MSNCLFDIFCNICKTIEMNDLSDDSQLEARPSIGRALGILDLFTIDAPSKTAEQICEERRLSLPTGYRYIRELVGAGLLVRLTGGRYSLGPKIIALDHTIRQSDPMLRVAAPVMADLVRRTGCACVLSCVNRGTAREIVSDAIERTLRGTPALL